MKSCSRIGSLREKKLFLVEGDLFNSGLNSVEVATRVQRAVATTIATTSPEVSKAFTVLLKCFHVFYR
jgi:hypothetical protein